MSNPAPFPSERLTEWQPPNELDPFVTPVEAAVGKCCADMNGKTVAAHAERRALAKKHKLDNVGWHTFRHAYRSWLDDAGAPIGVQQKLIRHSDITTTAKYGNALMESKRSTTALWPEGL